MEIYVCVKQILMSKENRHTPFNDDGLIDDRCLNIVHRIHYNQCETLLPHHLILTSVFDMEN
jgi:hypothetical protein